MEFLLLILPLFIIFILVWFFGLRKRPMSSLEGTDVLDVFVYGHSASGKSTLIQRLFFLDTSPIRSTVDFHIYEFEKPFNMGNMQKVKIRIADYRGQNPSELLMRAKNQQTIDCLLFIADVAPAYSSTNRKYSDSEILSVLSKNGKVDKNIQERVAEHEEYLGKWLIQTIFQFSMNPYLKNVYFLINKVDVLEDLKKQGFLEPDLNIDDYARSFYRKVIDDIQTFCTHSNIPNFQVQCISATQHKNIHELLNNIVSSFISNKVANGRV